MIDNHKKHKLSSRTKRPLSLRANEMSEAISFLRLRSLFRAKRRNPVAIGCLFASASPRNRFAPRDDGNKGFILAELLIATAIFAVVSAAIYSTFNSGMNVWRRAGKVSAGEIKNLIKIEKINNELRQVIFAQGERIAFFGNKRWIRFTLVIDSEINRVVYKFDENKKMLLRGSDKMKDAAIAAKRREGPTLQFIPYLKAVSDLSFSYYYFDINKGVYAWKDESGGVYGSPLAVRLSIALENGTYNSTIFLSCS